jgi:hypothetical protein
MKLDKSKEVKPMKTAWAEPQDHRQICLRMHMLLKRCGVEASWVRDRMTAHAIFASGWKQNCWCYNAWGVKLGTWQGSWYAMQTREVDKNGNWQTVKGAAWRAFDGWQEAVRDYLQRIAPGSSRYSRAHEALIREQPLEASDREFWAALQVGGYMTDKGFSPASFAALCARVRKEVFDAGPTDMESANAWLDQAIPYKEEIAGDQGKGGMAENGFFRDGDSGDSGGGDHGEVTNE